MIFSVFDLKGLLIKTYEAVSEDQFEFYGQKFYGNSKGWIQPDIYPEQFHRLIEVILGEQKKPFVMDRDPNEQIWSVPVYKANYKIEAIPGKPNAVKVRTWLYTAGPVDAGNKDFVGTKEVMKEYNYILYGEVEQQGTVLNVTSGSWESTQWTDSRENHPDFLFVPKSKKAKRATYNSNLDILKVDKILNSAISQQQQKP